MPTRTCSWLVRNVQPGSVAKQGHPAAGRQHGFDELVDGVIEDLRVLDVLGLGADQALEVAVADPAVHRLIARAADRLLSGTGPQRLRWAFTALVAGSAATPTPDSVDTPQSQEHHDNEQETS